MDRGIKWEIENSISDAFYDIYCKLRDIRDHCCDGYHSQNDICNEIELLMDEIGD